MLAPLDAVEINALLDKLPQRAELPQEADTFFYSLQDIINLARRREPPNTKSDTAVGALIAISERTEHVAGLEGRRCASTARRKGNILERHQ